MKIKLYENIEKLNRWTEGTLVKTLKLRLNGVEVLIFDERMKGETTNNIKKHLNISNEDFQKADATVKQKVRDYRQEARKWQNATEAEKNRINLLYLLSWMKRYDQLTEVQRKECFAKTDIPKETRDGVIAYLTALLW